MALFARAAGLPKACRGRSVLCRPSSPPYILKKKSLGSRLSGPLALISPQSRAVGPEEPRTHPSRRPRTVSPHASQRRGNLAREEESVTPEQNGSVDGSAHAFHRGRSVRLSAAASPAFPPPCARPPAGIRPTHCCITRRVDVILSGPPRRADRPSSGRRHRGTGAVLCRLKEPKEDG